MKENHSLSKVQMGDLNAKFCVRIKHIAHSMPTGSPRMWPLGGHTGATMWADMAGGGNVGFPGSGYGKGYRYA